MSTSINPIEDGLGYYFWPKPIAHAAGHPRLDIHIRSTASGQHFDPTGVQLHIFTSSDRPHFKAIEHLRVSHPWDYQTNYQVAPGMLIISDRNHKKVEGFTFGGALRIHKSDESTTCIIESDAPIIEIGSASPAILYLVEEFEIMLAKRRAIWIKDEEAFEARLANISPSLLYAAGLEDLIHQVEHSHGAERSEMRDLHKILVSEKQARITDDLWPEAIPLISDVL